MMRPLLSRLFSTGVLLLVFVSLTLSGAASAQPPEGVKDKESTPGQFFTVVEPITSDSNTTFSVSARQVVERNATKGREAVLIFEFLPGDIAPGSSEFGTSLQLANFLSTSLTGARRRIAFVPQPLRGYAVLAALACDEIVMGAGASLGPIAGDQSLDVAILREPVRVLAIRQGHDPDLFLGMLEPNRDLRAVRTSDRQLHFEFAENLAEFKKDHQVIEDVPAWEGGQRGILTATRAREMGFAKFNADSRAEVARAYHILGNAAADDPTLGQEIRPVWIEIKGPLGTRERASLGRLIEQERQARVNLLLFEIDSPGGLDSAADALADLIAGIKDMKTVAFINDRAMGVSALVALACSEIVFTKGAQMGDVHQLLTGRRNQSEELAERQIQALAGKAAELAKLKGHPAAVARAMVDPETILYSARDKNTQAACFVLKSQIDAEPERYGDLQIRKQAGHPLTITSDDAVSYGLGQVVSDVEEFKSFYGLRGKSIRMNGPTWVDTLVTVLTDPFVSWLLLFVGLFMLVLELKLPGIGLPAIASCVAFLLFFWSHYLSGTADQLEIILFLVGMICLALELFVFPGFGVFGMSGVLLILSSIVMASHTFIWPTQDYEYREMGFTLLQVTLAMVAVGGGAVVFARYFPSMPFLNRLVLKPEPWTVVGEEGSTNKPSMEGYESLAFLIGETGRTTTVLRPSGKARFGELLVDVTGDSFFIEPDSLVEVVDVQGSKVIVKRMDI